MITGIHVSGNLGYEVVEFAETLSNIDLILMDIRLPYEDGYGAFRKLRQIRNLITFLLLP